MSSTSTRTSGRDIIKDYTLGSTRSASDKIYLCGMEGCGATRAARAPTATTSASIPLEYFLGTHFPVFQGSITLEGVNPGGFSNNEPFGNLNIIVPSRMGLSCSEDDIARLTADAHSPENLAIESYYGAGIARVVWDAPSGGAAVINYQVEWQEAVTGEVMKSGVLPNTERGYNIAGKWLARWVRVSAIRAAGGGSIAWTAAVTSPADPLQVWFIEGTPRINASIGRVFFYTDTNVTV